ncbi:SoxR reducing system RseC family protein [Anaerococcus sp. AGMB00486]|uniref:SoxR reducing system RseC family protein n=2 Tax=Anaerococcus TaxID=165779 RepID=A0ABX2N7I5_9FIRM|nr:MULTISPECIES: SoxR reducing system RseC family protein [Anaerococcus]MDY3005453.1 SoxR reducing system RseC family protein [Anaerococcus porci]MSS76881.1 SoxR reducing system RseC family protein [Anaerococcus porci]NVF10635.1 SoxR reducing system RseC family protein [Anaerococcus faecalis]
MEIISKKGIVVENNNGNVKVMIQRDSGCGSCSTCGGCEVKPSYYTTFTNDDLNPGDFVFLDSDVKTVNKVSYLTYLFPVSMMTIGAILANTVFSNKGFDENLLTLLFIVGFLLISLIILRVYDKRYKNKNLIKIRKI